MTIVVPAIIPDTKEQMFKEIDSVADFADIVQIDISDGIFTKIKTWPYNGKDADFFDKLKKEESGWPFWDSLNFEIHLMVENPEKVVRDWIKTSAGTIIFHIESTKNPDEIIEICRENMVSVGVAIKPSTDVSHIEKIMNKIDFIQVMGSDHLGEHRIELEEKALEKIKSLRHFYPDSIIAVDIGVNQENAEKLSLAGATKFVSGSAILNSENPKETYKILSDF